ncbi:MAG: DUF4381 domain-containing protein [Pseudomonadota bacterium]
MSDRYEGLSLSQLLDLMHEIVVPDAVSWVPQTAGWWVVLGWLLSVATLCALRYAQYRRKNRYRREALEDLARIAETAAAEPAASAAAVAELLKRAALAAWPRERVASMYGPAWADFLIETCARDTEVVQAAPQLARAAYDPGVRGADLIAPARCWILRHRA